MNVYYEAASHKDGIDFYVSKCDKTLCVTRNESGEIETNIVPGLKQSKTSKRGKVLSIVVAAIYTVGSINHEIFKNEKFIFPLFMIIIWLYFVGECVIRGKRDIEFTKYHGAEHMALGYMDKYGKIPKSIEDMKEISFISYRCGSTFIVLLLAAIMVVGLTILFIPYLVLQIIVILMSLAGLVYLWACEKLNFVQKFVVAMPEDDKLELALYALNEREKMLKEK